MSKSLKQLKEELNSLVNEVTIDGNTGKVEDDSSPANKNLQRTPKNSKTTKQQSNVNQQKQLPPPSSNQQKALPPPQTKALANPSRVPVVVPSANVPANVQKKPEEKYMGKISPEKKPELNTSKPEASAQPEKQPEASTTSQPKDDKKATETPATTNSPVPPKASDKPSKQKSHIIKTGEPTPDRSEKKSGINLSSLLKTQRTGVGQRYSGPEHLLKQPTRSYSTRAGVVS